MVGAARESMNGMARRRLHRRGGLTNVLALVDTTVVGKQGGRHGVSLAGILSWLNSKGTGKNSSHVRM